MQLSGLTRLNRGPSRGGTSFIHKRFSIIAKAEDRVMNGIIYIVGLIVVIGVILSFFGLR